MQVFGLCILENGCPGIVTEYLPMTLLEWIEARSSQKADERIRQLAANLILDDV